MAVSLYIELEDDLRLSSQGKYAHSQILRVVRGPLHVPRRL